MIKKHLEKETKSDCLLNKSYSLREKELPLIRKSFSMNGAGFDFFKVLLIVLGKDLTLNRFCLKRRIEFRF